MIDSALEACSEILSASSFDIFTSPLLNFAGKVISSSIIGT
jgi:hypothetical protein